MKKRVLSMLMALALCLTLLPVPAWAEEADADGGAIVQEEQEELEEQEGQEEQEEASAAEPETDPPAVAEQATENAVAEVTAADGTSLGQYTSLNDAIAAAKDGSTVTLLANVTTTSPIQVESSTFTLDLNGKKWDKSGGYMLNVTGGSVTVTSSEGTGTISNTGGGTAINVAANAAVHVTNGVRLSRLFAAKDANLTLDVGVIITETLYANTENIAPFLAGKALQACDGNDKPIDGQYVSIYEKYDTNAKDTGCVIVIEHTRCDGTADSPCEICGYNGTQTKPTEPADLNVAEVNGTKYKTLAAAIAAANGEEITLLRVFGENVVVSDKDSKASIILGTGDTVEGEGTYPFYWTAAQDGNPPYIPLTMNAGEITLKDGVLAQFITGSNNNIAIKLNGGTLTVADTVTKIIGGSVDITSENTAQMAAIEATGGVLDLQGNTHLDGGLSISGDAQLAHKLTAGIFTNSGSTTASVSVEGDTTSYPPVSDSTEYKTVFDLLAEGYAFAKYNADGTTGDVIQKANDTKSLKEDVTVIKCTHKGANGTSLFKNDTCTGCGFTCSAHQLENGKCTVCGYECTHPSATEADGKYTCDTCKQQVVVKVTKGDKITYYAERRNDYNDETLWWLFNNVLESDSTVTLLADNLFAWAYVSNGKQITLDLNGKTLDETSQGITVGQGDQKDTTTNNKLIVKGTLGAGEVAEDNNYAFRTWVGGELNLKEVADGGKIGSIIANGGKVTTEDSTSDMKIGTLYINDGSTQLSFCAGTFDTICFSSFLEGNVTLGDLLAKNSGKAFQNADGKFVLYNTEIDGRYAVENVKIVTCTHDSITNDTCDYCNLDNLAAALIAADGTVTNYRSTDESDAGARILLALQAMQTSDNGKVKLFADCEYADKIMWEDNKQGTIDLNGHNVTYTGTMNMDGGLLMLNSGTLTITDSSTDKTGSFAYVMVKSGASLIADGAYVKRIFANESNSNVLLKAGSQFDTLNLSSSGLRLFNCLAEGCCISGKNLMTAVTYTGSALTVMQIPGTVTPPTDKNVSISYGGSVPDSFLPAVTLGDGVEASLTYEWIYRDSDFYKSPSDAPVTADGQPLDMICVITANKWSGGNTWETAVTGYTLTVSAANLADATVTATNANSLIFTPDENGDGQTQTLKFTVTYQDQYTTLTPGTDYEIVDSSNTAADAGEHTLTLQGLGNYAGTREYKWTVKPRELTGISDLSKPYDGTTALPNITFAYDDGTVTLTKGTDYTVTGSFDSADAGDRTVTATVTLTNPNYTFADGKTEQTFTVNTQITKAPVSDLKEVSQTIRCVAGVEQSFMPELTSFGIPADAQVQNISNVNCSGGAPVGSHGSKAPGVVYCTLSEGAKVGDTFSISFTIELTNYKDAYVTINVKLIDRDTPTVAANAITVTYNGSAVPAEKITGTATFDGETVDGTWSWKDDPARTNVSDSGEKTVIFTPTDVINYKPVERMLQLTIAPAALTDVSVQQTGELTYNGAEQTAAVKTTATAVNGQTVTFTFCDTPSGTYSESVPAFTDAGEYTVYYKASAPNHEDAAGTFKVIINKKDPICTAPTGVTAIYGQKLSELTLNNPDGNTPGEWTWTDSTQSVGNVGENTFTAKFTPDDQRNYNSKDTVTVTVTVSKAESSVSTAPTANTLTYTGEAQALIEPGTTADGTMLYSLSENGDYSESIPTGTNADTYTVWYKVKGDSNHNDSTPESVSVTIAKAQVTVTAKDKSAYVGSTAPDLSKPEQDKDYTVSGLIGSDTLTTAPTLTYDPATPDMTKTGDTAAIKAGGANAGDNYDITYVAGKLTVTTRPSSGGGGGSSSGSSVIKTETTTNPDGSVTKTETKSDGTVIETTTNKDGSTTKTEAKPDGSSKTEIKDANGSTGTVKTDKDGQTTAEAKISDKAVSDAKKADEAVKIPAEVTPGEDSASAPTVKIDLPSNSGETKIEIPVKDTTPGTVAVIVKPDGTEEIVKDSVPTEDGIQLTVDGDVTVKIVDNAKNFTDTKGHWAQDSIDFASARGLVNGTSSTTFSPNAPTTRAQLWTILARQARADLTGGANWYEKAQAWAKESGISDGTNPNGTITRAQMVTMLWRAAGSPEVTNASAFTDVPADSYYAKAVAWAVENGITTGIGSGKFDPNATCTRAQIATFLYRLYLSR